MSLDKTVQIGANPTWIDAGRSAQYSNVFITCRGDRSVYQFDLHANIVKVLRDSRMKDPVCAIGSNGRGPHMLSVMDFGGRQVLSYMREPLNPWGARILNGLGLDGNAPFEFTHAQPVQGHPFLFDVSEVN